MAKKKAAVVLPTDEKAAQNLAVTHVVELLGASITASEVAIAAFRRAGEAAPSYLPALVSDLEKAKGIFVGHLAPLTSSSPPAKVPAQVKPEANVVSEAAPEAAS